MPFDLDRFRRQYPDAMAELRDTEGWTRADLDDADAAVTAAYERNDAHELECWANWIAMYARRRRTRLATEAAEAADAADARLVRVVPLITPEELDQLQRSRATPAAPTPYRGRNPR